MLLLFRELNKYRSTWEVSPNGQFRVSMTCSLMNSNQPGDTQMGPRKEFGNMVGFQRWNSVCKWCSRVDLNVLKVQWHFGRDDSCLVCGWHSESTRHALVVALFSKFGKISKATAVDTFFRKPPKWVDYNMMADLQWELEKLNGIL